MFYRIILYSSLILFLFFILQAESASQYRQRSRLTNSTNDEDGTDEAAPSKKIYGTIIDKKCNCTKAVKKALTNAEEDEAPEEYEETPSYGKKRTTMKRKSIYSYGNEEEDDYAPAKPKKPTYKKPVNTTYDDSEDDVDYAPVKPKKKVAQYQNSTGDDYGTDTEEEQDYTPVKKPKAKKPTYASADDGEDDTDGYSGYTGYSGKAKPKKKPSSSSQYADMDQEDTDNYEPSYPKKNSTSQAYGKKKPAAYTDDYGEDEDTSYVPKKKATVKPKKSRPVYQEEDHTADNYDQDESGYDTGYEKPKKKATKRPIYKAPKKASYGDEEDAYSRPKPAKYKKTTPEPSYDDDDGEQVDYDIDQDYSGGKKNKTSSGSDYETPKKETEAPYAEKKPDHYHTTAKYHHPTTQSYDVDYGKEYGGSLGNNTVASPKVITVHQNASRETGILIKLVNKEDKKSE